MIKNFDLNLDKKSKYIFENAYNKALENNLKVMKVENNKLYEIRKDDTNKDLIKIYIKDVKSYKVKNKNFYINF